jgi:hypothetical protein
MPLTKSLTAARLKAGNSAVHLLKGGAMPPFLLLGALPDLLFILVLVSITPLFET